MKITVAKNTHFDAIVDYIREKAESFDCMVHFGTERRLEGYVVLDGRRFFLEMYVVDETTKEPSNGDSDQEEK